MKNLFVYTTLGGKKECFNVNKVIRAITNEDETITVLLDDIAERVFTEPNTTNQNGKIIKGGVMRDTVQSTITLSQEDGLRFFNNLNIE